MLIRPPFRFVEELSSGHAACNACSRRRTDLSNLALRTVLPEICTRLLLSRKRDVTPSSSAFPRTQAASRGKADDARDGTEPESQIATACTSYLADRERPVGDRRDRSG